MSTPTRLVIQNGSHANDGTGDTLRDASRKINDNFAVLFALYNALDSDGDGIADLDLIDASPSGGATNDF